MAQAVGDPETDDEREHDGDGAGDQTVVVEGAVPGTAYADRRMRAGGASARKIIGPVPPAPQNPRDQLGDGNPPTTSQTSTSRSAIRCSPVRALSDQQPDEAHGRKAHARRERRWTSSRLRYRPAGRRQRQAILDLSRCEPKGHQARPPLRRRPACCGEVGCSQGTA